MCLIPNWICENVLNLEEHPAVDCWLVYWLPEIGQNMFLFQEILAVVKSSHRMRLGGSPGDLPWGMLYSIVRVLKSDKEK